MSTTCYAVHSEPLLDVFYIETMIMIILMRKAKAVQKSKTKTSDHTYYTEWICL